jgi:hypothetical protein
VLGGIGDVETLPRIVHGDAARRLHLLGVPHHEPKPEVRTVNEHALHAVVADVDVVGPIHGNPDGQAEHRLPGQFPNRQELLAGWIHHHDGSPNGVGDDDAAVAVDGDAEGLREAVRVDLAGRRAALAEERVLEGCRSRTRGRAHVGGAAIHRDIAHARLVRRQRPDGLHGRVCGGLLLCLHNHDARNHPQNDSGNSCGRTVPCDRRPGNAISHWSLVNQALSPEPVSPQPSEAFSP